MYVSTNVLHCIILTCFVAWIAWYFYKCAWCKEREQFLAQAALIDDEEPTDIASASKNVPVKSLKEVEMSNEELRAKLAQHAQGKPVNIGAMDLGRLKDMIDALLKKQDFLIANDKHPLQVVKIEYAGSKVNGEHQVDVLVHRQGRSYGKHIRLTLSNGGASIVKVEVLGIVWQDMWELQKGADVFNKNRDSSWFAEHVSEEVKE